MTRRKLVDEPTPAIVVLAGGGSRRMGRDKLQLLQGDRTLLQLVVDQLTGYSTAPLRISGPKSQEISANVTWMGEHPPGGGPVAGVQAAVLDVDAEWTILMAGDAPRGPLAVPALLAQRDILTAEEDGVIVVDEQGRRQPLCAMYRTTSLIRALDDVGEVTGASLQQLLHNLTLVDLLDTWEAANDIDEPDDARRAGFV